jgi:uncharacterized protein YbjT (DUF2867 family)
MDANAGERLTRRVFVAGGTGYIGRRLLPALVARGHQVRALARSGSESRVQPGCDVVRGDPFDRRTFADALASCDTFLQLVGVPHPSPRKAQQFIDIDLRSARESIAAACEQRVPHFVYVSVAQPAPVMVAYQRARRQAEDALAGSGLARTIVRPWYVLGPGHRWPSLLVPVYAALEAIPSTRDSARRLGLVTLPQMVATLVDAIEHPPEVERLIEVPEIRAHRT